MRDTSLNKIFIKNRELITKVYFPSLLSFLCTLLLLLLISSYIKDKVEQNLIYLLKDHHSLASQIVINKIEERLGALDRMALRFKYSDYKSWKEEASYQYSYLKGFQAIEWADTSTKLEWIYPLKGNEAAIGLVLNKEGRRDYAINKAKESLRGTLTKPIQLKQGGTGFLSLHPTLDKSGSINGYIVGVFRTKDLFETLIDDAFSFRVLIADQQVFGSKNEDPNLISINRAYQIRNLDFKFIVYPEKELISAYQVNNRTRFIYMFSILFSLLVPSTIYFVMRSRFEQRKSSELSARVKRSLDEIAIYAETDKHGKIIDVNDNFCKISGFDRSELLGQDHRIVNSGYHSKQFFKEMWSTISQGHTWSAEVCNKGKSGQIYWVQTSIIPLISNGKVQGYSAIRYDITPRKKYEEEIVFQRKEVEKALEARSIFLANMSHEIRTPMNGMIGMATLLKDDISDPNIIKKVEIIESSGELLLSIVNDILDLSKIEAGKLELEKTPFQPRLVIEQVVELLTDKATLQNNKLVTHIHKSIPDWIVGDPFRTKQVLLNLLSNAIKFCKDGIVEVYMDIDPENEDSIVIQVKDTGIGIPESSISKLFTNFTQADESTTRKFGGTGLGLAICKSIVEAWGGKIRVISEEGKGSTFTFYIPLIIAQESQLKRENGSISNKKDYSSAAVLVVDDNDINQNIVKGFLNKSGITPDIANNGSEAITMVQKKKYDLIFMDCHMPILDGFETTREIKKKFNKACPFIIALTASATQEDRMKCQKAGMDDFISKPIRLKELNRILDTYLVNKESQKKAM